MPQPNLGLAGKPDFPQLDEAATDRADRIAARRRSAEGIEEARALIRHHADSEAAKERLDALPKLLGPKPETGEEWVDRGLRALEVSIVEGTGLNHKAATAYENACWKRAAVLEPAKYGKAEALPPPPVAPQHSELEFARRIAYALALGVRKQEREVGPILPDAVAGDGGKWDDGP